MNSLPIRDVLRLNMPSQVMLSRTKRNLRNTPLPNSLVRNLIRALQYLRQASHVNSVVIDWDDGASYVIGRGEIDQTMFTVDDRGYRSVLDRVYVNDVPAGQVLEAVIQQLRRGAHVIRMYVYRIGDTEQYYNHIVSRTNGLRKWHPIPHVPGIRNDYDAELLARPSLNTSNIQVRRTAIR